MNVAAARPLRVFISYRHADSRILDAIRDHLGWLENDNRIGIFDDRKVIAGENWDDRIKRELHQADIILLVVTARCMRSDYCTNVELKTALERRSKHATVIIPIIAETCDWVAMPIFTIAALPKDKDNNLEPLNKWGRDKDVALTQITQQVRYHVENLGIPKSAPTRSRNRIPKTTTTSRAHVPANADDTSTPDNMLRRVWLSQRRNNAFNRIVSV